MSVSWSHTSEDRFSGDMAVIKNNNQEVAHSLMAPRGRADKLEHKHESRHEKTCLVGGVVGVGGLQPDNAQTGHAAAEASKSLQISYIVTIGIIPTSLS